MLRKNKLNRIAIAVAMSIGMSTVAMAQETSSGISGKIVGPQGAPAAGTVITITHIPSGSTKTTTVNETGQFSAKGLRVGGPYSVKVDSDKFQDTTVNDLFLTLGESYSLDLSLDSEQSIESIVVTASAISTSMLGSTGPAANFNLADLESAPSINRDINDVIRSDPRIYIDESFNNAVQCGGSSPRFNSLTLDGVRLNDSFGLNSNGYPTERMPFSFDAIEQVAVELAPFDVQYGGFTACNINAVTKSGNNELHGSAFYDYTSDSLKGDSIEGDKVDNGNYTEKRYGVNVGFPLIQDTLFFFGSYEKLEGAQLFSYDALASGRVTQDDIDQITSIAKSAYGYDVGGTPASAPIEDEKLLVKLDWNINEDHRASLIYNYNDGFSLSQSDGGSSVLSLSNHFYKRGATLDSVVASVYSDWNSDFSTEVRIGKTKLDNTQASTDAASGFGEMQITTPGRATVYIGPDDSRQSNKLKYDTVNFKLAGTYYAGDHKITGGIEYEKLNVFNLFVQQSDGEYRFNSIADFEAGTPARIYYSNSAGTNNPDDAGASFSNTLTTLYIQDDFALNDDVTIKAGLRYDTYSSSDTPTENVNFGNRYGFSNTGNIDGVSLVQPRLGFNWRLDDNLELRGGIGLYSGGNPNVWISNAYSNDGVTKIDLEDRGTNYADSGMSLFDRTLVNNGQAGYDIPQNMFSEIASTAIGFGDGGVVAISPDFKTPSEWKYALGTTYITEDEYVVTADFLYTDKKDSAIYNDLSVTDSGDTAPDGRPLYEVTNPSRRSGSDFMLTNVTGADGSSTVLSVALSKEYDNGIKFNAAYAYVDSKDVNPMTSSVAFSNYANVAVSDQLNPGVATSDYEIKNRFTMNLSYKVELIDGYNTRFSLFGMASEGKPYSYTYTNSGSMFEDASDFRNLIYVPLENDPNVVYGSVTNSGVVTPFDLEGFNQFIEDEGLVRGEIQQRNAHSADWWVKFDARIEQEIPGFMEGHKASAFFVIKNIGNLLNDDWGVMKQGSFVGDDVISATINANGQYVYNSYNSSPQSTVIAPSLWEVRMGVKYKF